MRWYISSVCLLAACSKFIRSTNDTTYLTHNKGVKFSLDHCMATAIFPSIMPPKVCTKDPVRSKFS